MAIILQCKLEAVSFLGKLVAALFLLAAMWGLNSVESVPAHGGPVRILRFYASVGVVVDGDTAELCYGVENAKAVRMAPPLPGVYPALSRCLQVVPKHTTHYTILAEGYDGKVAMQSLTLPVQMKEPAERAVPVFRASLR